MGRLLEQRPEVVTNHVRGDLTAAHRAANEGADEILGVIQHELIARYRRDCLKRLERVGAVAWTIARQRSRVPVAAVEQLFDTFELLRPHRVGDVGLVYDDALYGHQPVVEVGARRIVGPTRGNQVNGLATGCTGTYPLEEVPRLPANKVNVCQKQVFIQPTAYQRFGRTRAVEQRFPFLDLCRLLGAGLDRVVLNWRARRQPTLQGLVLGIGQAGDRQRHALTGMRLGIGVELAGQRADIFPVQAQHDVFRQLGVWLQRG